jgi:O-antigen/teichoic acid export membrane protein
MPQLNEKLKEIAENVIGTLTIIAIPIAIGIFIFSSSIEEIVLGSQWSGTAIVLGVMALMHGFSWVVGMNGEFYRAMGKPSYETFVTGTLLTVYILTYLLVISSGLVTFVWVRFCLALVALVLHLYVLRRILQVDLIIVFGRMILITVISFISIGITKFAVFELISIDWVRLTIGVSVSVIMTLFLIYIVEKNKSVAYLISIAKTGSV